MKKKRLLRKKIRKQNIRWFILLWLGIAAAFCFQGDVWAMCNSASTSMCEKQFKEDNPDKAGQARSFCEQLKANDKACNAEIPLAAAYSTMAAVCLFECAVGWGAGAIGAICSLGSLAVSAAEMGFTLSIQNNKYGKEAAGNMASDWGMPLATASIALNGLATIGWFGNYGPSLFDTEELVAAKENKAIADARVAHAKVSDDTAYLNTCTSEAKCAKTTEDSQKDRSKNRNNSCFSAALNGIQAGIKWYDFNAIQHSSSRHKDNLNSLMTRNQVAGNQNQNLPLGKVTGAESAPASPNPTSLDLDTSDLASKVEALDNSGQLAATFANGPLKKLFNNPDPSKVKEATDNLKKLTGLTPAKISEAAQKNGIGATLGQIAESLGKNDPKVKNALNGIDNDINAYMSKHNLAYAEPAASVSSKKSSENPFQGLGNLFGRKPGSEGALSKPQTMNFTRPTKYDIWHRNTKKNIFEIISEKTQVEANKSGL